MNRTGNLNPEDLWEQHSGEWRHPLQITSQWQEANQTDPRLLEYQVEGAWWEVLASLDVTLLVTREYEHLVLAMQAAQAGPHLTYTRLPHPSGLVVDRDKNRVYIASTRNPNQVYDYRVTDGLLSRLDMEQYPSESQPLVPARSWFYPGCFYIHDLALIGGELYANSVGQNAVVHLNDDGSAERVWWPRCIESPETPHFEQNYIQLNSIAAGHSISSSFFSASADEITEVRPGHPDYEVDRRGVIFSGANGEVIARDLTRPHSARLYKGAVWVDNSGYGELGTVQAQKYQPVVKLPGWTRGLCFINNIGFVGTSRVIPRFRQYAPGLDVASSICGLHAIEMSTGKILGSIIWPYGNQIFAIDWLPGTVTSGFPFVAGETTPASQTLSFFYSYSMEDRIR